MLSRILRAPRKLEKHIASNKGQFEERSKEKESLQYGGRFSVDLHRDKFDRRLCFAGIEDAPEKTYFSYGYETTTVDGFSTRNEFGRFVHLDRAFVAEPNVSLGQPLTSFTAAQLALYKNLANMGVESIDLLASADTEFRTPFRNVFMMGTMMLEDVGLLPRGRTQSAMAPGADFRALYTVSQCLLGLAIGKYYGNDSALQYMPMNILGAQRVTLEEASAALIGRFWLCVIVAQAEADSIPLGKKVSVGIDFFPVIERFDFSDRRSYYERERSLSITVSEQVSKKTIKSVVIASEPRQRWFCEDAPPRSFVIPGSK